MVTAAYQGDVADRVRRFLPMVRRLAWHVNGTGRPGIEVEDLILAIPPVALSGLVRKTVHEEPDYSGPDLPIATQGEIGDGDCAVIREQSQARAPADNEALQGRKALALRSELAGGQGIEDADSRMTRGRPCHECQRQRRYPRHATQRQIVGHGHRGRNPGCRDQ